MEKSKIEFLHSLFVQIETQVQFGDSKASLLVAGDAILLAISGGLIKVVSGCEGAALTLSCMAPSIPLGLAAAAAAFLVLSLAFSLLAARPARIHARPNPDLFLLSYIASMDEGRFLKSFREASSDDLQRHALTTIHGKATYATRKFRWLKRAVDATLLSLVLMAATPLIAIALSLS